MKTIQHFLIESSFKDVLGILYIIAVLVLGFTALLEFKLAYNIDMLPGIDLPIDEWYEATFH